MATYVIDYFELPSSDGAATRAFVGEAFGWGLKEFGPSYAEIAEAGVVGGINSDAGDRSAGPLIGIRTDDIEAAARAVVMAGGEITRTPYAFPGGVRFYFRAPGGAEMMIYMET